MRAGGKPTKDKVCPLVTAGNEGANKTCNDHDLVDEQSPENRGPGHASSEHQVEQEQWRSDDPVDVADIVDGAVYTTDDGVAALELDGDGCEAQVGTHGKVGNASDKDDGGSDVVEDTVAAVLAEGESKEGKAGDAHGGADGEIEVGAMSGDGNLWIVRRMAVSR
jgi:hypothetical protein